MLVHLYKTNKTHFTGGALRDGIPSEGEVGARWAINLVLLLKIPPMKAPLRDTWFNFKNAQVILQQQQIDSVILVSDYFSSGTGRIMARDLGLHVQLSPTPTSKFNNFQRPTDSICT